MSALASALGYARRGWPIFPCAAPKKIPLLKRWGEIASTDPAQIEAWWRQWPNAFVGLPTGHRSNLIVLDIDCKHAAANGFDTLAALGLAMMPEAPMAHTRSGGLHIFFARTEHEIRNSVGSRGGIGPGVDVRGEGGFAVIPCPGSGYTWDPLYNFDTVAPLPAPAWLSHRQRHARQDDRCDRLTPAAILARACDRIRSAPDGHKHEILNREVFRIGTLVGAGLLRGDPARDDLETATAALIATSDADRERTWKSFDIAFADGLKAPRRARR